MNKFTSQKKSAYSKTETSNMTWSTLREKEHKSALAQYTKFREKGVLGHETMRTETECGRTVIKCI